MKKLVFFVGVLVAITFTIQTPSTAQKREPITLKFGDPLPANAFVELAKLINPAVVNISTSVRPKRMGRGQQDPFFDMLEQFYGYRMMPQQQMRPQTALGTGFVIRDDGLIVTNNHVIAGADEIRVQFDDKSEKYYDAKVVGSDDRTDIALIKIEGKGYPTVQLGSSKETDVGEWVAAFGNPYGNGHTITKGIISAKGRDINEINKFPLLQTDAPINPGNSGGPLVNLKGQVIGVNSAIDARAQGIGFAIPIDDVKSILPQLEKSGRIKKAFLGVGLADLDPQSAMALGMKDWEGAVVAQVDPKSPAALGGLRPYDVITEFNNKKIKNSSELRGLVADAPIGSEISMKVIREGRSKSLKITLAERPDPEAQRRELKKSKSLGLAAPSEWGFAASELTPELRKKFEIEDDVQKPIVTEVVPGGLAARSGLLTGDIVLDVNRKEVESPSDLFKNLKKGGNTMRISRQGTVLFLMLKD